MNATISKSTQYGGGGVKLPQPVVAQRLTDYCRRQWCKTPVQLNQYQRQLAVFILTEYHGFEPKQLVGLLSRSKSQIYADLQIIGIYRKTQQFKDDAENMNKYILDNRPLFYY